MKGIPAQPALRPAVQSAVGTLGITNQHIRIVSRALKHAQSLALAQTH